MSKKRLYLDCTPDEAVRRARIYNLANQPKIGEYTICEATPFKIPIDKNLSIEWTGLHIPISHTVIRERDTDGMPTKLTVSNDAFISLAFMPWYDGSTAFLAICQCPKMESYFDAIIDASAGRAIKSKGEPGNLDYTEDKICKVYQDLLAEGLTPTDELIAARLPVGPKGQNYTRETINRKRNKMRKRGMKV